MKTKNILKIGVLSIILFALIISPILKSITPEANAFTLWTSAGTSTTGLNFKDYLNTCTSSGANNTIANNPTVYTVLCCNDKDHNLAVRNSSSYSTIVSNCETAQQNASDQAIPVPAEGWCTDALKYGQLSQSDKAIAYIEKCCKPEDSKTKYIKDRCKNAYDTINTDLKEEVVYEQETDIKNCVVQKYDENDSVIKLLYNDNPLYIKECCNLTEGQVNSLSPSDQGLLAQRCIWAAQSEDISLFDGKPHDQISPPPPPDYTTDYWGVQQYVDYETKIAEKSPEDICGFKDEDWPQIWTKDYWIHVSCLIQKGIIEGLGKMFAAMINSQIGMILWAFDPATYGGFVNNPAVQGTEGNPGVWNFIRNLVNMLLVLALVIIAIATILGYKKYAWKQVLWKLIIVALLVNFSLVISGMILDVSNFFAYTFLNQAKLDNKNIAESMISSFDTEKLSGPEKYKITPLPPVAQDVKEGWGLSWGNFLIASLSLIIIGLFAFIALLGVFVAMIVRSFILIALLCITPVAFAAWIFPDTEKYWKMWWDQFIKWCTFPIFFGLMLWIGVFAVNKLGIETSGTELGMIPFIVRVFLFSMFLVGGLIFSLQSGGAVAKNVTKQASKLGLAVGGFTGYKVQKGVTGSETYRKAQEKLEGSKFAPLHDIGVWMSRQPGKIRAAELKQIAEDYKNRTPDQIRADRGAHKNDKARAAVAINELIERKKVNYEKDSEFINIAKNQSNLNVPGLKKAHPELYVDYFTKPEDMEKEIRKVQLTAPHAMKLDEAKNRARINLITKRVKEADSDAIKSGNWDNVLERLEQQGISENKGAQYIDRFFESLWKEKVVPEGYAAMFRSMDIEKQRKWAQEFVNSIGRITNKKPKEVVSELDKKNFYRNRFLTELLPEREEKEK